jgi:hypothetical protein
VPAGALNAPRAAGRADLWLRVLLAAAFCVAAAATALFFHLPAHLMLEEGAPVGGLGPGVSSQRAYLQPLPFAGARVSTVDVAVIGTASGGAPSSGVVRLLGPDGRELGRAAVVASSAAQRDLRIPLAQPVTVGDEGGLFIEVCASPAAGQAGVTPVGTSLGMQGPAYAAAGTTAAGTAAQEAQAGATRLPLSMSVRVWGLGPRSLRAETAARVLGAAALALLAAAVLLWHRLAAAVSPRAARSRAWWGRVEERFSRSRWSAPGRYLSEDHLIRFDLRTQAVCVGVLVAFVLLVLAGVHYSSIEGWNTFVPPGPGDPPARALLLGNVKTIRTDEYVAGTPILLNRYASPLGLSAGRAAVDAASPWLWGFHFLGLERGFAFMWQFWYLGALLSFFLLMLLLTRNDFWVAVVSSLVLFFSAYNRWWDTTVQVTTFSLSLLGLVYFLQARRRASVVGGLVFFLIFGAGFVLALYPAWQVQLSYLGLALLVGVLARRGSLAHAREHWRLRAGLAAAGIAGLLGAAAAGYSANAQSLRDMSSTIYPGHRVSAGGDLTGYTFFSGYLDPLFTSGRFYRGNNCETSAYIFLWPWVLTAALIERLTGAVRRLPSVLVASGVYLVALAGFVLVGYGSLVAKVSLMSYVPGKRAYIGLGIAGVVFVGVYLGQRPVRRTPAWVGASVAAVLFAGLVWFMWAFRQRYPTSTWSLEWSVALPAAAAIAVSVAAAVLRARVLFFALVLALVLVPSIGVIPVSRGLAPIYGKALVKEVRQVVAEDPHGRWLVYGDLVTPDLVRAAGADVVNGVRFPPEKPLLNGLDRSGRFASVWNRYAHVRAFLGAPGSAPGFRLEQLDYYTLTVDPADPALAAAGVRYFVAPAGSGQYFPAPEFRKLTPAPLNGFDVYERVPAG